MSISFSNNIKENDIRFSDENLLGGIGWEVLEGSASISDKISLQSKSSVLAVLNYAEEDYLTGQYMKLVCRVTCSDKTLSTLNSHNVSINFIIHYIDNDENACVVVNSYYPAYAFEEHYDGGFTIIDIPNTKITNVEVIIINNEDVEVEIAYYGMFLSKLLDERDIRDEVDRYLKSSNVFLIIPFVEQLPDISTVSDGSCFRLPYYVEE